MIKLTIRLLGVLLLLGALVLNPMRQANAQTCNTLWCTEPLTSTIYIYNNEWGNNGYGTGSITVNSSSSWSTSWNFDNTNSWNVTSFPSAILGWENGSMMDANTGMEFPVSSNTPVNGNVTWSITASDAYDVAYDNWYFANNNISNTTPTDELMIWLGDSGNSASVGGWEITDVVIDGITFNVYGNVNANEGTSGNWSRFNFVVAGSNVQTAALNFSDFTNWVVSNGYMSNSYYFGAVMFGVEMYNDNVGTLTVSNYTAAVGTLSVPPAPTGLTATAGNAQAALTWSGSSGATSYNVLRSTVNGSGYASVATGISTTNYTNTGLTNGTTYYFVVTAVNSAGTSGNSNQASATPVMSVPVIQINAGGPAVSPFIADTDWTGSGSTYTATNTINTSAVTSPAPMAVYQSERYGPMTYTIPGLTSGTTYTVRLHFSENTWTAAGQRQFNVAINGTAVLTNFDIFATAGAQFKANIQQFTAAANSSGQIVIGFTNGAHDNVKVDGIEVDSTSGSAPSAPTSLSATAGNAQVSLSWTASSGATSYNVYRGTSSGGESGTAIATGLTTTSYTNTGLTNGTTYYFTVKALNSSGTSGASNEASAVPSGGGGGTVIQINTGGPAASPFVADTDWTGSSNTLTVTNTINTSAVTSPAPMTVYQSERYGAMTYTIPSLTSGTTYTVRLHFSENYWTAAGQRKFNVSINGNSVLANFDIYATAGAEFKANVQQFSAAANGSGQLVIVFSNGSADQAKVDGVEVDSTSGGSAPSAPTGLSATSGNAQVSLSWTASSGATSYNVYRGTSAGGESGTAITTGLTTTAYTNTGLTNGTTYFFTVKALNSNGTSGASNEASATPSAGTTPVLQIACGGAAVSPFVADTDFTGGNGTLSVTNTINTSAVTNPAPMAVYQTERYGPMTYTLTGLTSGSTYTVRLHFSENYWTGAGQRAFNVSINGTTVLTNFDIFATAGAEFKANVQQFSTTANTSGQIVVVFTTGSHDLPKIDGIEVDH